MATLTAPLAIIKVNGVEVGLMKSVRISEDFRRMPVKGLGRLNATEAPIVDWTGKLNAAFYMVDFNTTGMPNAITRAAPTVNAFIDNILMAQGGIDITLYKKVDGGTDPDTGLKTAILQEMTTVRGCLLERDSLDVNEGQISGRNQDFMYLDPIIATV